jgi:hypothetical protein
MSVLTMNPVLRRGRSVLDRRLMPADESEGRLDRLLAAASAAGLDGVLVFGNAHMPQDLVYFANYMPTTFIGTIVARPGHPPTLIAGKGGGRDHPYIRTISWIDDIRFYPDLGEGVLTIVDAWDLKAPRLGTVGLDTTLPHEMQESVVAAIPAERRVALDAEVIEMRRTKSARELLVMRDATELAAGAAAAAVAAYEDGASRREALAAADFAARSQGAEDCRVTAGSRDGIVPLSEVEDESSAPFSLLVAVEALGYWGLATATSGDAASDGTVSDGALDAVVSGLRPGVRVGDVLPRSGDAEGFVLGGIGCALGEFPDGEQDPDAELVEGEVVSIVHWRGGAATVLTSRTVVLESSGARDL